MFALVVALSDVFSLSISALHMGNDQNYGFNNDFHGEQGHVCPCGDTVRCLRPLGIDATNMGVDKRVINDHVGMKGWHYQVSQLS